MIRKLFGETEEEQFRYLQKRLIALGIGIVIFLIGFLLSEIGISFGSVIGRLGTGICVIVLLIFGWAVMRGLFGFATAGALFSNNFVIGIVIFVLFLTIGYFAGFFVACIGLCRYLALLKKRKGSC